MSVGIVSYGVYTPYQFISSSKISSEAVRLGLGKKSLASWDEDSITMAVYAALRAIQQAKINAKDIGSIYIGSESPPYAVKPSSTIVADIIGMNKHYRAVDLQFACKAATAGLQMTAAEVGQKHITYGMVIGSDKSQARTGDPLELSAGAAASAVIVGDKNVIAKIIDMVSISSDTPDFWRREHQQYPSHGGRFTAQPAYFSHVIQSTQSLMKKNSLLSKDINHVVFHMPNGAFPIKVCEYFGFTPKQYMYGMTVKDIGNPYSAAALFGLSNVLDHAKPKQRILMVSYGSGAGSDAVLFETTKHISNIKRGQVMKLLERRKEVQLDEYRQMERWT